MRIYYYCDYYPEYIVYTAHTHTHTNLYIYKGQICGQLESMKKKEWERERNAEFVSHSQ